MSKNYKILFLSTFTIVFIIGLLALWYFKDINKEQEINPSQEKGEKRYAEIYDSLEDAIKWYLDATFVIKNGYNCTNYTGQFLKEDDFISNGLLKQEDMLDVDGASYCSGTVRTEMGENCNIEYEITFRCKDYETPGHVEWWS